MGAAHCIGRLTFETHFDGESAAFEAQAELRSFASGRLQVVLDDVLSGWSPAGASATVRIERLDVDLGRLSAESWREEIEERLRERLNEALDRLSLSPAVDWESAGQSARIVSRPQSELEIVACFLESGQLPWNFRTASAQALEQMLWRAVRESGAQFVRRIASARDVSAVRRRLAWQFPSELFGAVDELIDSWGDELKDLEEPLEKAIASGEFRWVAVEWSLLARTRPDLIEEAVRRLGLRSEVRRRLAVRFPEGALRDVAAILEPAGVDFIEELTGRPEVFRRTAEEAGEDASAVGSEASVKARMWEFTLTYLIVERGGNFNRREYVSSVVRQMAAHRNLSCATLVVSLTAVLERVEVESRVKREMLALLADLAPRFELDEVSEIERDEPSPSVEELLAAALTTGDVRPLQKHWGNLLRAEPEVMERVVRRLGVHPAVRYILAYKFPESMCRDIARVLARSELDCIVEVYESLRDNAPELRSRFWERTLARLLLENGGRFHGREYEQYVTFDGEERLLPICRGSEELEKLVDAALASGDMRALQARCEDLLLTQPRVIERFVRARGIDVAVRRAMARGFDDPALRSLCGVLWPSGWRSIEELLSSCRVFCMAVGESAASEPEVKQRLWEWTLDYLLGARSAFSGDAYAVGIVKRMAAQYRLGYDELVESLSHAFPVRGRNAFSLERQETPFIDAFLRLESGEAAARELSKLALRFLADESGSGFRKDAFVAAMVRRVAVLKDVRAEDVVTSWLAMEARTAVERELQALLRSEAERVASRPDTFRAYEVYDVLSGCLLRDAAPPASGLASLIEEVVFEHPAVVGRLLAEWRATAAAEGLDNIIPADVPLDAGSIGRNKGQYRLLLERVLRARKQGARYPDTSAEQEITAALLRAAGLSSGDRASLIRRLDGFGERPPAALLKVLRGVPSGSPMWASLVRVLPERQLARLVKWLGGSNWQRLLRVADSLANSASSRGFGGSRRVQELKWKFLFEYVMQSGSRCSEKEFARRLHAQLAGKREAAPPRSSGKRDLSFEGEAFLEEILVRNAGQVLATPYLPRLFGMLGLLEGSGFRDEERAGRAAHVLQYLVDESTDAPEHVLSLNKILCGLPPETPVMRVSDLTEEEKDAVDGLLRAMIAHWGKLGNTSAQGLRQSFFQRDGRLRLRENSWRMLVETRAFDMLLDGLPWAFSVIRHPWMTRTLYVEWR
ncbi:MAG TPA: contractile injection system tape measure protein [Bryobacteraceae bacterium]|nr:contractile injection system tape measure protein [Bryobacteraceae bacterium]